MGYKITPNYFALKYWDRMFDDSIKLHSISYDRCNFRCGFCNFSNRHSEEYIEYTQEAFEKKVMELKYKGSYFKFTGGEPTLNRFLIRDLRIVKKESCFVFLDSNGSNPEIIRQIADEGLIDVLGISIKGVSKDAAAKTAGVQNAKSSWDNVLKSIKIADDYHIRTIVTMVFHNDIKVENIAAFAKLLETYTNIHLKINNLLETEYQGDFEYKKLDEEVLIDYLKSFVKRRPMWKGRITLVNSNEATTNSDAVMFL